MEGAPLTAAAAAAGGAPYSSSISYADQQQETEDTETAEAGGPLCYPPLSSGTGLGAPGGAPWVPAFDGESLTAGREVLVLPKLVSTPDVRLLQD